MAVALLPDETPVLGWCFPAGSISGVRLGIHWSFPLVLVFVSTLQGAKHGAWWGFVVAVAVPLLLCLVVFREFGRLVAARRLFVPFPRIEVWPLGGRTSIGSDVRGIKETKLALAGPIVHLLLTGFFLGAFSVAGVTVGDDFLDPFHWWPVSTLGGTADFGEHVLYLVHKLNLVVLLVNLVPAWPLDGGRIVRGLLDPLLGAVRAKRLTAVIALGSTAAVFGYSVHLRHYLVAAIAVVVFLWSRGRMKRVP
jgi:Zn-dependent protease